MVRNSYLSTALVLAAIGTPTSVLAASSSACSTSSDADYTYQITPLVDFTFYWKLEGSTTLKGKVAYTGGEAWVSVGPSNSDGDMIGGEVVLGLPDAGTVQKYTLSSYSKSGVDLMPTSQQTLTDTSISSSSASTTMMFEKLLSESGELEISATDATTFIFAYGSSASLGFHKAYGAASINLANCETTTIATETLSEAAVMAHGILMVAAWMWLVPFGILAAVYRHKLGPGWIKVHTVIQTSAFVVMLCAYFVIAISIEDTGGDHYVDANTDYGSHTLLGGLALFLMGGYQVLSGWLRPHAQILLASEDASQGGNGRDDQTTKTMARQWFELTHKSMGRLAPVVALLAILSGAAWAESINTIESGAGLVALAVIPFVGFVVAYAYKVATMGI